MKKWNDGGQITVFLSMMFLVFLGLSFCVLEGIHGYIESALAEEAATELGDEILASYDKYIFKKYHVFFLDPREKESMESEMKDYINHYISSGFYGLSCEELEITEEKSAVDEKGLFLRYQINEYMKYRHAAMAVDGLKKLASSAKGGDDGDFHGGGDSGDSSDKEEEEDDSPEAKKHRADWIAFKNTLTSIANAGVLAFAMENPEKLSTAAISTEDLPSGGDSDKVFELPAFSWQSLSEWSSFLRSGISGDSSGIDIGGSINLISYIFECYSRYGDEEKEDPGVLKYEIEYLIGGHAKDKANLKHVTNRIMLMRFVINYAHARKNPEIQGELGVVSVVLTGFLGFPNAEKVVRVLLTAALSYGESLLELRALMHGKRVAFVKKASNWNLSLSGAAALLSSKSGIRKVKGGVSYQDYLMFFLCLKNTSDTLIYRMMDIMQVNTQQHEPGFLMKDSLFSFNYRVKVSCPRWFISFPGGKRLENSFSMEFERYTGY